MLTIIMMGLILYRFIKIKQTIFLLTANKFLSLLPQFSWQRQYSKTVLLIVSWLLIAVALLRPQKELPNYKIAQQTRDLFIALDISRSMLATDCQPNRLSCAKKKIKELITTLSSDRVALIIFSGSAFMYCPLTSDYNAFNLFLDSVDVESISSGSTSLAALFATILDTMKHLGSEGERLVVLFTDGEDFSANLSELKEKLKQERVNIFAVGVGTAQGAPIPLYDHKGTLTGHQKNEEGNVVISRLNAPLLTKLTQEVGGMYMAMEENSRDIQHIVQKVETYKKQQQEKKEISFFQEQYPYLILPALLALLIEWLL